MKKLTFDVPNEFGPEDLNLLMKYKDMYEALKNIKDLCRRISHGEFSEFKDISSVKLANTLTKFVAEETKGIPNMN